MERLFKSTDGHLCGHPQIHIKRQPAAVTDSLRDLECGQVENLKWRWKNIHDAAAAAAAAAAEPAAELPAALAPVAAAALPAHLQYGNCGASDQLHEDPVHNIIK